MSVRTRRGSSLKLYWVITDDGDEDWFVIARSAREACRFHEECEGYDIGMASSSLVTALPEQCQDERYVGHPTRELLVKCGAEIERWQTPRAVVFGGVRYVEGMLESLILERSDDVAEQRGRGRPHGTRKLRSN